MRTGRSYRERAALDAATVAAKLEWYPRKVNLVETGQRKLVAAETDRLVQLYELSDAEGAYVQRLAREARKRDTSTPQVAEWAQTYVAVEAAAAELRILYEGLLPGFVQTEEYARAILRRGVAPPERGIEDAVRQRVSRQQHITGPEAPEVTLVLDEGAVRRCVGGAETMRRQLEFLEQLADLPHMARHVLPFVAGEHAALGNSFSLVYVGDPVVTFTYTETFADGHWYDRSPRTGQYELAFEQAYQASLSETDTIALFGRIIGEMEGDSHAQR